MAREILPVDTCDLCHTQGKPHVPATEIAVPITGPNGETLEAEFCTPCALYYRIIAPQAATFASILQALPTFYGTLRKTNPGPQPTQPDQLTLPATTDTAPRRIHIQQIMVRCPLPHRSTTQQAKPVAYGNRASHARECHGGKNLWDIPWEYPETEGITWYPCTSHAECIETGNRYLEGKSLRNHIAHTKRLRRIDQ